MVKIQSVMARRGTPCCTQGQKEKGFTEVKPVDKAEKETETY
jgi:hypothetical protein